MTDDGEVDLDVIRREFEQAALVAVAAAIVVERERAGAAGNIALGLESVQIKPLFLCDLDDKMRQQMGEAAEVFLLLLVRQMLACDGIDEQQPLLGDPAALLEREEGPGGMEEGDALDLVQAILLLGKAQHIVG